MTDDEYTAKYANLFDAKDMNELSEAFDAAIKESKKTPTATKPAKDGIFYHHDEQNSDGHTLSVYAVVLGKKIVAWAIVDNDVEETDEKILAPLGEIPFGITVHRIFIHNAHRTDGYMSGGLAMRHLHSTKVHVSRHSIMTYVSTRLGCIMGHLYGI
jgi:hypothetical protein